MPSTFFVLQWSYVNKETHSPALAGVTETIEIDERHFVQEPQANPLLSIYSLPLVSCVPLPFINCSNSHLFRTLWWMAFLCLYQILEIPSMKLNVDAGKPRKRKMFKIMHYLC